MSEVNASMVAGQRGTVEPFDVARIREDFPILRQTVRDKPLVYLDNAATTQKPQAVIDTLLQYYGAQNANIHRGVYRLSVKATELYEEARRKVRRFLNASRVEEIVFTSGTTDAINLVAQSYVRPRVSRGDEILLTEMEHHSNIVPWQLLCEQTGATIRVVPINEAGELEMNRFHELLTDRTKFVAISHVSNALGTINPVAEMVAAAHERGVSVLVDGAQGVPHLPVDVTAIDCDFYAFSGHKVFGPTGVGALHAKYELLEEMPPWRGGGDMIKSVSFDGTVYNDVPYKFEAGTPNIAGVIGLGAALDYVSAIGLSAIAEYEGRLLDHATRVFSSLPHVRVIGTAAEKASVMSFVVDDVHPHDVGTILDQQGIAVRTGHHCAQPVMTHFGVPATVRASLAFYNTTAEIDALATGLNEVIAVFE